jgi:hypothetical protein
MSSKRGVGLGEARIRASEIRDAAAAEGHLESPNADRALPSAYGRTSPYRTSRHKSRDEVRHMDGAGVMSFALLVVIGVLFAVLAR